MSELKDRALLILTGLGASALVVFLATGSIRVFGDWHAFMVILAFVGGWTSLVEAFWTLRDPNTDRRAFSRRFTWSSVAIAVGVAYLFALPPTRVVLGEIAMPSLVLATVLPRKTARKWVSRLFDFSLVAVFLAGLWRLIPR
jgi:hypothetical protein